MDACYYKPPYHILLSHIWQPLPPSIYRHCQINAWLRHSYCCQRIKVNIVHVHTAKRRDAKPNKSQIEAVCLIIFLWSAKGITTWDCVIACCCKIIVVPTAVNENDFILIKDTLTWVSLSFSARAAQMNGIPGRTSHQCHLPAAATHLCIKSSWPHTSVNWSQPIWSMANL